MLASRLSAEAGVVAVDKRTVDAVLGTGGKPDPNPPAPCTKEQASGDPQEVPIKGMVTMVDVGAKACIPCKMMIPVIESLSEEYEGRAAIVFIDVWKNPDESPKFGLRAIPTQIFYDKDGNEVMRHEGYFSKEEIIKVLTKLGVD